MTNNTDEFDQDQFETLDASGDEPAPQKRGMMEVWRNNPLIKLLVIMVVVSGAVAIVLSAASKDKQPIVSQVAKPPGIKEAPGGTATPFFIEQNDQANQQRSEAALVQGGSALPTPVGHDVTELLDKNKKDPLKEFREETERLRAEQQNIQAQNDRKLQLMQQQMNVQNQKKVVQQDDSLARAMQKQMQDLMEGWKPTRAQVVSGVVDEKSKGKGKDSSAMSDASFADPTLSKPTKEMTKPKVLVPAGTVNYMQLLTEANSDVPGPILAQVLSGPLAGGRAIGRFQVANEYLVMSFNTVSLKGKDYKIDGLALDPDTTLGGMATEVDHRYFTRVLLPAAASFVSAFGEALADTDTTTTVTDNAVLVDNAKKGYKDAIYAGVGSVGQTVSQFFQQQANQTKTLVRVAVGTPMGLFFLSPVTDEAPDWSEISARKDDGGNVPSGSNAMPYPDAGKTKSKLSPEQASQMEMINQIMSTMSPTAGGTTGSR